MKIDIRVLNYIIHYYLQPFEPLSSDFEKWVSWDEVITSFSNLIICSSSKDVTLKITLLTEVVKLALIFPTFWSFC